MENKLEELRAEREFLDNIGENLKLLYDYDPITFESTVQKYIKIRNDFNVELGKAYLEYFNLRKPESPSIQFHTAEAESTKPVKELNQLAGGINNGAKQDLEQPASIGSPWKIGYNNMVEAWSNAALLTDYVGSAALMMPHYAGSFLGNPGLKEFAKYRNAMIEDPVVGKYISKVISKAKLELKKEDYPTGKYAKSPEKWYGYLDPKRAYMVIAQNTPLMGSFIVANAINPVMGTLLMGAVESGDALKTIREFEEMTGQKVDEDTKQMIIVSVGAINGALEKLGLDAILGKIPGAKGKIAKTLIASGTESGTEGLEELVQILGEDVYNKASKDRWKRFMESAYAGLLLGFLGGGVKNITDYMKESVKEDIKTSETFDYSKVGGSFEASPAGKDVANAEKIGEQAQATGEQVGPEGGTEEQVRVRDTEKAGLGAEAGEEKVTDQPVKEPVEEPAEQPVEEPVKESTEQPVEEQSAEEEVVIPDFTVKNDTEDATALGQRIKGNQELLDEVYNRRQEMRKKIYEEKGSQKAYEYSKIAQLYREAWEEATGEKIIEPTKDELLKSIESGTGESIKLTEPQVEEKLKPTKTKKLMALETWVKQRGGINGKHLREHGIDPKHDRGLYLRLARKEGMGLDDLAQSAINEGLIPPPPRDYNPTDWFVEKLKEKAKIGDYTNIPFRGLSDEELQYEYNELGKMGAIAEDLSFEKFKEMMAKNKEPEIITTGNLKVGDSFTIGGERFKVTKEVNDALIIKDGDTMEVDATFDNITIDKGSLKKAEETKPAKSYEREFIEEKAKEGLDITKVETMKTKQEKREALKENIAEEKKKGQEDLFVKQEEGKQLDLFEERKNVADRIRGFKFKGTPITIDFGISINLYNAAIDFIADQVEKGTKLGDAILAGIKFIDSKMAGKPWKKDEFKKYIIDSLGEEKPKEEGTVGLRVADIERIRKEFNLDELPEQKRQGFEQLLAEVRAEGLDEQAVNIAKDVISKPRTLTPKEHVALVLKVTKLQNEYEDLLNKAEKEINDGNKVVADRYMRLANRTIEDIDTITEASRYSDREAGRSLNIIRFRLKRADYSLAKLTQRLKLAKRGELTEKESFKLKEFAEKIKEQEERIKRLTEELKNYEEKLIRKEAEKFFEEKQRNVKRLRRSAKLVEKRKNIKAQLAALGYRVNDVTGLTFEAARLIGSLAETYIAEGVNNLNDLVKAIRNDIPDITDRDIFDSFGGRIKRIKKTVESDVRKNIRRLKKEARLLSEIEDAYDKMISEGLSEDEAKALKDKLNRLKQSSYETIENEKRLTDIHLRISHVHDQIEKGYRDVKKRKKEDTEEIKAAKQELNELKRLMRTLDKISDLEEQLKTGNFKIPQRRLNVVKNAELRDAQVKLRMLQRQVNSYIANAKKMSALDILVDVVSSLRSIKVTADFGWLLRQSLLLSKRRPIVAAKAFTKAFPAFFSEYRAEEINQAIMEHPFQVERERAGLYIAPLERISFTAQEEVFASNLAQRVPGLGKIIRASERNMVIGLNLIRVACFDAFYEANPEATDAELKAWADYVNVASGRGNLGKFEAATKSLSIVFFAPRFMVSRVQTPYKLIQYWKHKNVRKEIVKDYAAFGALGGLTLTLASLAGFNVVIDPEDPDFGKIIIGNTRYDIWGGFLQPMRTIIAILLQGLDRVGVRKLAKERDPWDLVSRFALYKLSPGITFPKELLTGKTIVGEEITVTETVVESIIPIVLLDIWDVYNNSGNIFKTAATGVYSLLGGNVSEYRINKESDKILNRLIKENENLINYRNGQVSYTKKGREVLEKYYEILEQKGIETAGAERNFLVRSKYGFNNYEVNYLIKNIPMKRKVDYLNRLKKRMGTEKFDKFYDELFNFGVITLQLDKEFNSQEN